MDLKDSIKINCRPEKVYNWLINNFIKDYKRLHSKHVLAKWVKGKNFEVGSIMYFKEYLNGGLEKLSAKAVKNVKNRLIEYRFLFPHCIICQKGSFIIKPQKNGSVFTAVLSFRLGWILSKIMPSKVNALKKHMKEEGDNLKKILEK